MLDELVVENLGLIGRAHIEPGAGLVAVTGETGAGKTLLLGALRLLRGDPARRDRIGPAGEEARVEGRFLVDGTEIVAARRVRSDRSRAYLDGSMVPASVLEERLGPLVEIVAQNEHVALGRETSLRALIDAGIDDSRAVAAYREAWEQLGALRADRLALGGDRHALVRARDLAAHQAAEIGEAALAPGEDGELAIVLERLRHAEEIAAALAEAHRALSDEGGGADAVAGAARSTARAVRHDPSLGRLAERLDALESDLGELVVDLRRAGDDLAHDPEALDAAERRAALIGDLRRKYGDSSDEVLEFGTAAAARTAELDSLLERAESLAAEIDRAQDAVTAAGARLASARRASAERLAAGAARHLLDLGFEAPVVGLQVEDAEPSGSGADRIELRFSSDRALQPAPVTRIASGGELSRLVLAVRLAGGVADAPVVAFDEIDAGVGGVTALAMGEKLAALATGRQVLVVTHLPQVAAFADTHLVVERTGREAAVRAVAGAERLAELTRMLGGLPESERGRDHAEELVALAVDLRGA